MVLCPSFMVRFEPRLVDSFGALKNGWMHRDAKVPLLGGFRVYKNAKLAESYTDFSKRGTLMVKLLNGRFSLILFDSGSEFKRITGTHTKNNFLATRPGIYAFSKAGKTEPRLYVGEGKDLFVRLKKHLSDKKIEELSIGFCLISTDEKLLRGEDPLLSEGLRGTIETSVKWLFHAWKNHSIGPGYNFGALQILTHVTASGTPRSDGHYIISTNEADLALEIVSEVYDIFNKLTSHSVLYNMCVNRLNLNPKRLPKLNDILISF